MAENSSQNVVFCFATALGLILFRVIGVGFGGLGGQREVTPLAGCQSITRLTHTDTHTRFPKSQNLRLMSLHILILNLHHKI